MGPEYIAFREIDPEGDVWGEDVFLFENEDLVNAFFDEWNVDFVHRYTEDEDSPRKLFDLEIGRSTNGEISTVTFSSNYSGKVKIYRMAKGFVFNKT